MLGFEELVFLAIIALILLSPEKLIEFTREIGKIYAEYKKAKRLVELEVLYGVSSQELREEMERKYKELNITAKDAKDEKSYLQ